MLPYSLNLVRALNSHASCFKTITTTLPGRECWLVMRPNELYWSGLIPKILVHKPNFPLEPKFRLGECSLLELENAS